MLPPGRPTLSVLMPVHDGVEPQYLERALESVAAQTRLPDEVLVVEDGPIGPALTRVLEAFARAHPDGFRRVRLSVNSGAGAALALGMQEVRGDVVARLDSDDIALPQRFEVQLRHLECTGSDVVGASMLEFEGEESNVLGIRRLPATHAAITRYARSRSPVNHPTAMFRRAAVLDAGNYVPLGYVEDYDLWARMLSRGAQLSNIAEPLVLFRCDPSMYARRGGLQHFRAEWALQQRLVSYGLIGQFRRALNLVVRLGFRLLPRPLLRFLYGLVFRRPTSPAAPPPMASSVPPT